MDLGLGKFLEYFREFFGDFATKSFILLTSVTFAVFCINLLLTKAIIPIYNAGLVIISGEIVTSITGSAVFAGILAFLIGAFASFVGAWLLSKLVSMTSIGNSFSRNDRSQLELEELKVQAEVARVRALRHLIDNGANDEVREFIKSEESRLNILDK